MWPRQWCCRHLFHFCVPSGKGHPVSLICQCLLTWYSLPYHTRGHLQCSFTGPKDLLSDRCVLSCPSMDLVTCLLDFRLNLASNRSIVPRLAASLAACAQLSALGKWSLHSHICLTVWKKMVNFLIFPICSFQLPATECGPFKDWGSCLQQNLGSRLT